MYFNKWVNLVVSLSITLVGALMAVDWTQYVSATTAGKIVVALGLVKAVTNVVAPSGNTQVIPNNGPIIAQKATGQTTAGNG